MVTLIGSTALKTAVSKAVDALTTKAASWYNTWYDQSTSPKKKGTSKNKGTSTEIPPPTTGRTLLGKRKLPTDPPKPQANKKQRREWRREKKKNELFNWNYFLFIISYYSLLFPIIKCSIVFTSAQYILRQLQSQSATMKSILWLYCLVPVTNYTLFHLVNYLN